MVFWAPCGSGGGGMDGWDGGGWRVGGGWGVPTHLHMHTHAHMCVKHDNFMQMAAPIRGIPGVCVCVHMHACMCTCVGGTLSPPPPPRGTPGISQNSIALELIEIFQFRLKI